MVKVIPLRYGTAFKKAFGDPEVFSAFVQDVIGKKFHFDRVEQEKGLLAPRGAVDIRFDLYAEDDQHRAIVELQHVRETDMFARFNYYHLSAQLEQVRSAKKYKPDRTVYTIVVLTRLPEDENLRFDIASQSSDLITHDGRPLQLFQDRLVFLNARALNASTPQPIRKWLELIEDSLDDTVDETNYLHPLLRKIIQSIEDDHLTSTERYWYKEEAIWDETKALSFQEGKNEGHKEGRKEERKLRIHDLCDAFDISLFESRRTYLDSLDLEALDTLLLRIKQEKQWPED